MGERKGDGGKKRGWGERKGDGGKEKGMGGKKRGWGERKGDGGKKKGMGKEKGMGERKGDGENFFLFVCCFLLPFKKEKKRSTLYHEQPEVEMQL